MESKAVYSKIAVAHSGANAAQLRNFTAKQETMKSIILFAAL
jgi:hypothetical protein